MMNSYQSQTGLTPTNKSPSKGDLKPPTGPRITESPYYSAHNTAQKFFKTIDESPLLGARGNTPKAKPAFTNKYRAGSLYETQDFRHSKTNVGGGVSAIHMRNQDVEKWRQKAPFDSNIEHGLTFMERIVR